MTEKYCTVTDNTNRESTLPFLLYCYDEQNRLQQLIECRTQMEAYARGVYWVEDTKPDFIQYH